MLLLCRHFHQLEAFKNLSTRKNLYEMFSFLIRHIIASLLLINFVELLVENVKLT